MHVVPLRVGPAAVVEVRVYPPCAQYGAHLLDHLLGRAVDHGRAHLPYAWYHTAGAWDYMHMHGTICICTTGVCSAHTVGGRRAHRAALPPLAAQLAEQRLQVGPHAVTTLAPAGEREVTAEGTLL